MFSESIKESIGLAKGAAGPPDVSGMCVRVEP